MAGTLEPERPDELRARALLEVEFSTTLDRIAPRDIETVDYRTPDGSRGIEVKRITNADYQDLTKAFGKAKVFESTLLTGHWTVMVERPTLSTTLEPMRDFPDDDPEDIARLEERGLTVIRKAEREAAWRAEHPGTRTQPTPRIVNMGRDLEPHFVVLESHGLTTTRGAYPYGQPEDLAIAIVEIARRTGDALCTCREPLSMESPGVGIALSSSYTRTERADTVVGRLDLWLGSDESSGNLRKSLANEPSGTERHAVLVFDAQTEPEYQAAIEQGIAFCPTVPLELPPEIDVLWFILASVACRFSASGGWTSHVMPDGNGS